MKRILTIPLLLLSILLLTFPCNVIKRTINPLLLLSILLLTFPLCACDDEEQLTLPDDNTAQVTYTVGDLKDLFQLSDVTVTYRDASGALQSETLAESAWTKTLTDVAVPFSPFMVVSYRTKEGVVLDKASYSFSRNFAIRVQTGASVSNNSSIYIENNRIKRRIKRI